MRKEKNIAADTMPENNIEGKKEINKTGKKAFGKRDKQAQIKNRVYLSVLLVLLALVALTAATVAWFSIADRTRVQTMGLDIIADVELRMDLDAHDTIEQYVKTLSFDTIAARMQQEKGFSMESTPLEPVTTNDCRVFSTEDGTVVESTSGAYLEFTLHFMAANDMIVHLTSANSSDANADGTAVNSNNAGLPQAMRISFETDDQIYVFDPGAGDNSRTNGIMKTFGLPASADMKLTDTNAMFSLKKGEDKAVLVHIWLEGTDPACTDDLKAADYSIRLRFSGTDMDGQPFSQ